MNIVEHRSRLRSAARAALALAVTLGMLALAAPTFNAADTLPAQISDEAFWKMIEDFSEDGGTFTSENFSSNERGYQNLMTRLQAYKLGREIDTEYGLVTAPRRKTALPTVSKESICTSSWLR